MKKKLISVLLSGVMVCTLFGCGKGAEEKPAAEAPAEKAAEGAADSGKTAEAGEPAAEEPAAQEPEAPAESPEEDGGNSADSTAELMDTLLDEPGFINGKSPREVGYEWMCLNETGRKREGDIIFDEMDNGGYDEMLSSLKKADWDNDGISEYYLGGSPFYGGLYFDLIEGVLAAEAGYGPYGMGWSGVVYMDGAYWVYDVSGDLGRIYEFKKYNENHEVTDTIYYQEEVNQDDEKDVKYSKGKDIDHMEAVSEEEFNKVCGDDVLNTDKELPEPENGGDEEFTKELYTNIESFFNGESPVLATFGGEG